MDEEVFSYMYSSSKPSVIIHQKLDCIFFNFLYFRIFFYFSKKWYIEWNGLCIQENSVWCQFYQESKLIFNILELKIGRGNSMGIRWV